MLTDDQLTAELRDAMHAAAGDLTYSGPVPRPRPALLAPAVAVTGAAAVGAVVVLAPQHHAAPRPTVAGPDVAGPATPAPSTATPTATPTGAPATRTLSLAGFSLTYTQQAGQQQLVASFVRSVPSGTTSIGSDDGTQKYVGTDPATGWQAAWIRLPRCTEVGVPSGTSRPCLSDVIEVTSPDVTRAELVADVQPTRAIAVPLVSASR